MQIEKEQEVLQLLTDQRKLLVEQMKILLEPLHPSLLSDVQFVLRGKGKLLASLKAENLTLPSIMQIGLWPLLTFQVALLVNPEVEILQAVRVALSIECLICALDILDDVEDGDSSPAIEQLGVGRALNVATALLMLTERSLSTLPVLQQQPALLLALLNGIREKTFLAIEGQHLDLLAEKLTLDEVSEEQCLEMAEGKAGALLSAACYLGALSGGAEPQLCERLAEIGKQAGVLHQLKNDCLDLYRLLDEDGQTASSDFLKSDLQRSKKTLPIVLAHQFYKQDLVEGKAPQMNEMFYQQGIIAAWGIQLLYEDRIAASLKELESIVPDTLLLRMMLGVA